MHALAREFTDARRAGGDCVIACVSQATTMPAPFADDVAAFAGAGCRAMEIWLTKLEQHLKSETMDATRRLLGDAGVTPVAAAYQGGLLLSQGEARAAHYEHFRRRLELCEALGIKVLLVVADFTAQANPSDLERAIVSMGQAAQWAAGYGVTIALEFRAGDTFCTCLETAVRLVTACGEPNVGVNCDAFHFFKGPSKTEDLRLLTAKNLAFVQICDWSGVPRELASDADRIMPGDGELPLEEWLRASAAAGYTGPVSLELMNPTFWQMKPSQVIELGLAAVTRVLPD